MSERTDPERDDPATCTCCQERLEQLATIVHEANARILAQLEAMSQHLDKLAALLHEQLAAILEEE